MTYNQEDLQERCVDFIEAHTNDVFKTKGFHELSEDSFTLLLKSDSLQMDELDLLNAVREWATVNAVSVLNTVLLPTQDGGGELV